MSSRWLATVFACAVILLAACDREADVQPPAPSSAASSSASPSASVVELPPEPETLYLVDGRKLVAVDLDSGARTTLTLLPSSDVVLSPDATSWAAVEDTKPGRADEGYGDPQIVVGPVDGSSEGIALGPGMAPLWSQDGTRVAATVGQEGYLICDPTVDPEAVQRNEDEKGCVTAERVVVYEPDADPDISLGAGLWTIVGWTSDDRIVAASSESELVKIGTTGDAPESNQQVPFPPDQVWGVSPEDLKVIAVTPKETMLASIEGEEPIGLKASEALGDGAWSPDGSTVAAAVISKPSGESRLLLIDATTGETRSVPSSEGAQGNVVWRADSSAFTYVQIDPDDRSRLQATVCDAASLTCTPALTWARGIRLLGLR